MPSLQASLEEAHNLPRLYRPVRRLSDGDLGYELLWLDFQLGGAGPVVRQVLIVALPLRLDQRDGQLSCHSTDLSLDSQRLLEVVADERRGLAHDVPARHGEAVDVADG